MSLYERYARRAVNRKWWISHIKTISVLALAMLLTMEIGLRFGLGLGNPVLMKAGTTYRYICVPDQTLQRFGRKVHINRWSMRSQHIDKLKRNPDEFRVMVIGDSVVFGTTLIDQKEIATSLMIAQLSERLRRPVKTMNVSAGSWNISDQVAYLEEFGHFDADVVLWVLNSGDLEPNDYSVQVVGVHPQFPDKRPFTALGELFGRYLLPRFGFFAQEEAPGREFEQEEIDEVLDQFRNTLSKLEDAGVEVFIVFYPNRNQLDGFPTSFSDPIRETVDLLNVEIVDLTEVIDAALKSGVEFFYDVIHPTTTGQSMLSRWLTDIVVERSGT